MTWQERSSTWGKSASAVPVPQRRKPAWLKGLVAGIVIVVCGGLAWWLLAPTAPVDPKPVPNALKSAKVRPLKTAVPSKHPATVVVPAKPQTATEAEEKWDDSFIKIPEKRYKFSTLETVTTSNTGVVNQRWRMPNGRYWRRQIDPPPIFSNPSDQTIAMALGDRSGSPIAPYPGFDDANLNEEFTKSLAQPIRIGEDDPPWKAALKMAVKEVREEILASIKAGDTRSVGEILRDHVQENNRQADLKGEALMGYYKIQREEGDAAAEVYLEKVNKALKGFGVTPIKSKSTGKSSRKESKQ